MKTLRFFIALSLLQVISCKEDKEQAPSAGSGAETGDEAYGLTLNEMKAFCQENLKFSFVGVEGTTGQPLYTGNDGGANSFQFGIRVLSTCEPKYSREELTAKIGAELVDPILTRLQEWSVSEFNRFANRTLEADFDQAMLQQVSSAADGTLAWVFRFSTLGTGNSAITISTSESLSVGVYNIVSTAYTSADIQAAAGIFNTRANGVEGTCAGCHGENTQGPLLNAAYIEACGDTGVAGAIRNGSYGQSGDPCAGDDLAESDPHAFTVTITEAEALSIVGWIRSQ